MRPAIFYILLPALLAGQCIGNLSNKKIQDEIRRAQDRVSIPHGNAKYPGELVAAYLFVLGNDASVDLTNLDPGSVQPETQDPYALSSDEAEQLNLTVLVGEARNEYSPMIRQFQAEELKKVSEFIGSPEFQEIGDMIGYPENYQPGMTLTDIQRAYVRDIETEIQSASPEKVELYRQTITYQIFGLIDMIRKISFNDYTIDQSFLEASLYDLVELRKKIIDRQRRIEAGEL